MEFRPEACYQSHARGQLDNGHTEDRKRKWGRDRTEIETEAEEKFNLYYKTLDWIDIVTEYGALPRCPAFYVIRMTNVQIVIISILQMRTLRLTLFKWFAPR